jgi:phage-related protein
MQIFEVFGDLIFRDHNTRQQLNNLSGTVDRVQAGFQQFGANIMNIGSKISGFGNMMYNNVTVPIVNVVKDSIMMRSDLTESFNVIDTVFGKSSNEVKDWSDNLMQDFGMTKLRALDYVGSMGAMLEASGLNAKQTKTFSKSLVELTGDMSSFYNLSHEEVWEKIRAGISGETEPLKSLGINMSVANLEAYALSKGINKAWKEMSQAEQVNLRYNYLMEKTKKVQGDFAKTSDSFANRLRLLSGEWDNLKMAIGEKLMPIAEKALDFFVKFKEKIQDIPGIGKMAAGLAVVAAVIGPLAILFGTVVTVIGGFIAVVSAIGAPILAAVAAVGLILPVLAALEAAILYVYYKTGILRAAFEFIKGVIEAVAAAIQGNGALAFNILTEKLGISESKALAFVAQIRRATMAVQRVGEVVKDVAKLISLMFAGKQQAIIDLLVKKFGMSKKEAVEFAAKLQNLKNKAIEFANKVKSVAITAMTEFGKKITQVSKFIYDHRAEIAKAIGKMVDFAGKVVSAMSKILSAASKAKTFADRVKSYISSGISGAISVLNKLNRSASSVFSAVASAAYKVKSAIQSIVGAVSSVINKIASIHFPKPPSWFPGFAKGVTNFAGGVALVGENGPEIVELPGGSNVIPNHKVKDYVRDLQPLRVDESQTVTKGPQSIYIDFKNMIVHQRSDVDYLLNQLMSKLKLKGVRIKNA